MDILERYLSIVPFPVLLALLVVACVAVLVIPPRLRLPLGLFVLPVWLTLSQGQELGAISGVATATAGLLYVYIGLAAVLDPSVKRPVPGILWLYPLLGAFSLFLCMTTVDRAHALLVQLQWILLTLAVILVARTVTDGQSLGRVIRPLTLGVIVALLVPLADVLITGPAVIRRVGRFWPWGANPNQMGLLFSLAIPLSLYFAITIRRLPVRILCGSAAGAAGAMILLTASRGVLVVALIPLIPLLMAVTKRPVLAFALGVVVAGATLLVLPDVEAQAGRLLTAQTGRWDTVAQYLEVIAERPFTGLLGTTGQHFLIDPTIGGHMHNAYIFVLYQGGVLFFLPYLLLLGFTLFCAFRVWRRRWLLPQDPLLTSMLVFSVIAVYMHGFVNMTIYYSTYLWAFWHVLLSAMVIAWAGDVSRLRAAGDAYHEHEYEEIPYAPEPAYGLDDGP